MRVEISFILERTVKLCESPGKARGLPSCSEDHSITPSGPGTKGGDSDEKNRAQHRSIFPLFCGFLCVVLREFSGVFGSKKPAYL